MSGEFRIMRTAAVMLILNKDGLVLGVSRRDDKTKFGLPGGKREPNETTAEAAIRETIEETGIKVNSYEFLYSRVEPAHKDGVGYDFYTYCYYALDWEGTPSESEEGNVKWVKSEELTGETGAFPEYNRLTLEKFKELFPEVMVQ